jgi:hypothetical protein
MSADGEAPAHGGPFLEAATAADLAGDHGGPIPYSKLLPGGYDLLLTTYGSGL